MDQFSTFCCATLLFRYYFCSQQSCLLSCVSCFLKQLFCCSAQKTPDVSPFPLAAVAKSLPMRSSNLLVLPAAALEPLMPGQCCPCLPSQFCHLFFGTHWWHLGSLCICFKALFFTFDVFSVAPLTCSCPDFSLGSVIPFTPSHSVPLSIISLPLQSCPSEVVSDVFSCLPFLYYTACSLGHAVCLHLFQRVLRTTAGLYK